MTSGYRAGDELEDLCRVCKSVRPHRIIAVDPTGGLRVICDYCGSQHNYRGGDRAVERDGARAERQEARGTLAVDGEPPRLQAWQRSTTPGRSPAPARSGALSAVSERERRFPPMKIESTDGEQVDLELMLRRIIREESGLTLAPPAERWRDGILVLRPGRADLQEKSWPIETFFHKIVMLRNRLRVLEQQINGSALPEDEKVRLQSYITGCYGTLTSFNVLFADDDDKFRGSGE
jgi:hypothetical protein